MRPFLASICPSLRSAPVCSYIKAVSVAGPPGGEASGEAVGPPKMRSYPTLPTLSLFLTHPPPALLPRSVTPTPAPRRSNRRLQLTPFLRPPPQLSNKKPGGPVGDPPRRRSPSPAAAAAMVECGGGGGGPGRRRRRHREQRERARRIRRRRRRRRQQRRRRRRGRRRRAPQMAATAPALLPRGPAR